MWGHRDLARPRPSGTLSRMRRGCRGWSAGFSRSGDCLKAGLQRESEIALLAAVERRPLTCPPGHRPPPGDATAQKLESRL
jgi:hypothetical protein